MTNDELLKIRNFGEKSLDELMTKLKDGGMLGDRDRSTESTDQEDGGNLEEDGQSLQLKQVSGLFEGLVGDDVPQIVYAGGDLSVDDDEALWKDDNDSADDEEEEEE